MDSRRPLFIIGSPRSGTSLLRLILTSHSQIVIPPECGFLIWLFEKYEKWSEHDVIDPNVLGKFLDDLYGCKKFDTWHLDQKKLEMLLVTTSPKNYASLCAAIYISYAEKFSKKAAMWGDKNNFYLGHLKTLDAIYPGARFLHIVRDGRDVACSYREVMQQGSSSPYSPKLNNDIALIAEEWASNVLKVDEYCRRLDYSRKMLVKYEDLVKDTAATVTSICEWLNLPYEKQMLKFYEENRRLNLEPKLTLDWKRRTLEPISESTVGRHRSTLLPNEIQLFNDLASTAISRFGYL